MCFGSFTPSTLCVTTKYWVHDQAVLWRCSVADLAVDQAPQHHSPDQRLDRREHVTNHRIVRRRDDCFVNGQIALRHDRQAVGGLECRKRFLQAFGVGVIVLTCRHCRSLTFEHVASIDQIPRGDLAGSNERRERLLLTADVEPGDEGATTDVRFD